MADSLYRFVDRFANWPVVALLVVILFISFQLFNGREEILGPQNQVLDTRRWYTPQDVSQLFNDIGPKRFTYAVTELTLDVIFPLSYGLLFAILLINTSGPRYDWLLFFPWLTVTFDLLENIIISTMAFTFDGSVTPLAWAAAVCTFSKSLMFLLSLVIVLNGGIVGLFQRKMAR